jgi:hypothetical protein
MNLICRGAQQLGIPLICLPHGVRYHYRQEFCWDVNMNGVFGDEVVRGLVQMQPALNGRVRSIGGSHLALQGQIDPGEDAQRLKGPWRVCYMVNSTYIHCYPDTAREIEADFRVLAKAIDQVGGRLRIRTHPRTIEADTYRIIIDRMAADRVPFELSDSHSSLNRDLAECSASLLRIWGGAGIMSMYAECPLLGWVPREGLELSSEVLKSLPTCVSNADTLAATLREIAEKPSRRQSYLDAQEIFFEGQVSDPHGDPYARSLEMIDEFMMG